MQRSSVDRAARGLRVWIRTWDLAPWRRGRHRRACRGSKSSVSGLWTARPLRGADVPHQPPTARSRRISHIWCRCSTGAAVLCRGARTAPPRPLHPPTAGHLQDHVAEMWSRPEVVVGQGTTCRGDSACRASGERGRPTAAPAFYQLTRERPRVESFVVRNRVAWCGSSGCGRRPPYCCCW